MTYQEKNACFTKIDKERIHIVEAEKSERIFIRESKKEGQDRLDLKKKKKTSRKKGYALEKANERKDTRRKTNKKAKERIPTKKSEKRISTKKAKRWIR